MRCPNCGNENPPDYMFCDECGARLQETGVEAGTDTATDATAQPVEPQGDSENGAQIVGLAGMNLAEESNTATDDAQQYGDPADSSAPLAEEDTDASGLDVPLTEDTVATPYGATASDMTGDESGATGMDQEPMPGVVAIDEEEAPPLVGAHADSPEAMDAVSAPLPGGVAAMDESTGWAATALQDLDQAQAALAKGDWATFGQAMGTLRAALENAVQGGAAAPMRGGASSIGMDQDAGMSPDMGGSGSRTVIAPVSHGMGNGSGGAVAEGLSDVPAVEAMSGAGSPALAPSGQDALSGAASTMTGGVSRLVIISTGAELALPEQEEITIGREDPSSGIFPDVDLTPYGGEEGGVSRRHARLLHVGDEYFVEDLQSTNYTKLDGQRLPAHVRERLDDGARIDIGRVAMIFRKS